MTGTIFTDAVALKTFNSRQNVCFFARSVRFPQAHASGNSVDFRIEQTYLNFIAEQPKAVLV
ncbi:MAG: hypothetical protein EOO64_01290 [Massilia sp.]|nr:MAG: hypothetical protein EOO64_01290 [Massilia sp.]